MNGFQPLVWLNDDEDIDSLGRGEESLLGNSMMSFGARNQAIDNFLTRFNGTAYLISLTNKKKFSNMHQKDTSLVSSPYSPH